MHRITISLFTLFYFFPFFLHAQVISTFYGPLEVEERVLLDLIESPAFQRLRGVRQYGVSFYSSPYQENYTRYDHSLGVFAILRIKGACLQEQIAGLLHDVSHTAFSHVGDILFKMGYQEMAYQDTIHESFCQEYGIGAILQKYGILVEEISPKNPSFTALEQPLPNLSADRIDYNIQGAYHRGCLTYEEVITLINGLEFRKGIWIAKDPLLWKKVVDFSLHMSEKCWGSADNHVSSAYLAQAIRYALEKGLLTTDEISFGTDSALFSKLEESQDPVIANLLYKVLHVEDYFILNRENPDILLIARFRGIDPYIENEEEELIRLTGLDRELHQKFQQTFESMSQGVGISFK